MTSDRPAARRVFIKSIGAATPAIVSARAIAAPAVSRAQEERTGAVNPSPELMNTVSNYLVASSAMALDPVVLTKAKSHILDTFAATISGASFKVGKLSRDFARAQGGAAEASVAGESFLTNATNAALANGNMAHADETDDSHEPSSTHPGCAIIPAALAVAEKEGIGGLSFIKSVVVGYDIGCRINQAMNKEELSERNIATHAIGGVFGAVAACISAMRLDNTKTRYAFDYAAQQASGTRLYVRDLEHVQKAFVFGGLPARSGVMAAAMAQAGFTGVHDIFSGESNWFRTFTSNPKPELLVARLGSDHPVMATNIKKYSVGSPIQAPVEALTILIERHKLKAPAVRAIEVRVPGFGVVDNRLMPDINLQYCLAATLLDGTLSFKAAHDFARMKDPAILAVRERLTVIADPSLRLPQTSRTAKVTLKLEDGSTVSEHVKAVPGTAQNPMTVAQVEAKARDILTPEIGGPQTERLIEAVRTLETVKNVRDLRPLFRRA